MAKNALLDRLQYVRQMYTCLYIASDDGETCFDPLFFHYPEDPDLYDASKVESSFIFANAVKVSPVFADNATTVDSYFPNGQWVNIHNYSDIVTANGTEGKMGEWKTLDAPADNTSMINAHLMPGAILIKQDNSNGTIMTTHDLMNQSVPVQLIMNRDENMQASGRVFLDDGISLKSL